MEGIKRSDVYFASKAERALGVVCRGFDKPYFAFHDRPWEPVYTQTGIEACKISDLIDDREENKSP